ncbi:CGNR zinc finger domain-containing protein [Nonomuraea sp. NPDC050536]|uniref:CGNR zinc finger domain-containing protein n=1 Tax=Nonomuraea sp. NPDC050536 TaxID=3364366 RepID=UPI0037CB905B
MEFREGAGRLSLDYIRTLRRRGLADEAEELPDAKALATWIHQFVPGLLTTAARDSGEGSGGDVRVEEAWELREAVHALVLAARAGRVVGQGERDVVNRAAARPVPAPLLGGDGRLRWAAEDPVAAVLSLVARDVLELVTSPAIERVRACAGDGCAALFLDGSRPGTRRWCSMGTCGNRAKKQTLRARAAGAS